MNEYGKWEGLNDDDDEEEDDDDDDAPQIVSSKKAKENVLEQARLREIQRQKLKSMRSERQARALVEKTKAVAKREAKEREEKKKESEKEGGEEEEEELGALPAGILDRLSEERDARALDDLQLKRRQKEEQRLQAALFKEKVE